jgi:hypothetical protein
MDKNKCPKNFYPRRLFPEIIEKSSKNASLPYTSEHSIKENQLTA